MYKNLIRICLISAVMASLVACDPYKDHVPVVSTEADTIPTIVLTPDTTPVTSAADITIEIGTGNIVVEGGDLYTEYSIEPRTILIKVDEYGHLIFLRVNSTNLLEDKQGNSYDYLDPNTLVVKKGNTISKIAEDHNMTLQEFYQLNPHFKKKTLKVGDRVSLE